MTQRQRNFLRWSLYSAGFLLVLLLSTSVLGNRTFLGTKLSLLPVYAACVACREGHEQGGLFALITAAFWALSGASGGAVFVFLLPLGSMVAGYITSAYVTRSLMPAVGGSLLNLVLCEGAVYVQRLFLGSPMPADASRLVLLQIGFPLLTTPLFWWLTGKIAKAGDRHGT